MQCVVVTTWASVDVKLLLHCGQCRSATMPRHPSGRPAAYVGIRFRRPVLCNLTSSLASLFYFLQFFLFQTLCSSSSLSSSPSSSSSSPSTSSFSSSSFFVVLFLFTLFLFLVSEPSRFWRQNDVIAHVAPRFFRSTRRTAAVGGHQRGCSCRRPTPQYAARTRRPDDHWHCLPIDLLLYLLGKALNDADLGVDRQPQP